MVVLAGLAVMESNMRVHVLTVLAPQDLSKEVK